jgi:acyl CoA:acetate/3-ketoacid CoA transferase beta subunit
MSPVPSAPSPTCCRFPSATENSPKRRTHTVVSTPKIFRYWLQGGRVDVRFLGAAQLDRYANLNTTVIGDYLHPVRPSSQPTTLRENASRITARKTNSPASRM